MQQYRVYCIQKLDNELKKERVVRVNVFAECIAEALNKAKELFGKIINFPYKIGDFAMFFICHKISATCNSDKRAAGGEFVELPIVKISFMFVKRGKTRVRVYDVFRRFYNILKTAF